MPEPHRLARVDHGKQFAGHRLRAADSHGNRGHRCLGLHMDPGGTQFRHCAVCGSGKFRLFPHLPGGRDSLLVGQIALGAADFLTLSGER
ncbi:hypothetical protein OG203_08200 [Nocardia sp. NBC_01499]|uniref:hypothetical protein n=1 Tax=Nocardia sp. NBC_01499 TaxID=2903597 RepID=UPI0038671887